MPERYGIWSLVASFGVFSVLLDMGLASGTTRYVAHYEELGERAMVVRAVAVSFWILLALGALALVVGGVLALLFPHIFQLPAGQEEPASVLVLLVSAATAITIVGGAFQGCLAGLLRYSVLNLIRVVAVVAQATAFAVCIWLGGQLVALGLALLVVTLAEMIARYVAVRRLLPDLTLSRRFIDRGFASGILRMSAWISSTQIATAIRYRVDTIVVGLVAGVRAAGVYAVGQLLFVAAERFIRPVTTGIFPLSAELAGRHDAEGLRLAVITGTRISLAVGGPLCLAGILLAGPLVDAWIGPGFEDARVVIAYLLSALLLAQVSRPGFVMLQGSGNVKAPAAILWAEAVLNLALSLLLGVLLGVTGVALATLIATAAVSTAVGVPYLCRAFGMATSTFAVKLVRAHALPIAVAILTGWIVSPGDNAGLVAVLAAGALVAIAYLAALVFTGLTRAERRRVWAIVRRSGSQAVSPS